MDQPTSRKLNTVKNLLSKKDFAANCLLLLIIIGGGFLRLYRLEYSHVGSDQSILYSIALDWVNGGQLPLAANKASVGALNPPFVEYLIALPLFIKRSLLSPIVFQSILNLTAIPIIYWACKRFFDRKVALFAAALFAFNPWVVYYSRFIWNPNHIPFFATLLLVSLWLYLDEQKPIYLILSFVWLSIITQLHLGSLVMVPVVGLILLVFGRRWWRGRLWTTFWPFLAGILLLVSLYIPYLLFERAVGFQDIRSLLGVLTGTGLSGEVNVNSAALLLMLELTTGNNFFLNHPTVWRDALSNWNWLFQLARFTTIMALVYAIVAPFYRRFAHRDWKRKLSSSHVSLLVIGLWVIIPVILYIRHTYYLQNYFFLYLFPASLILVAVFWGNLFDWLAKLSAPQWRYPALAIVTIPVILILGWQFFMYRTRLVLINSSVEGQDHTVGDLQTAINYLGQAHQANPDCDIILLDRGYKLDSSPVGMLDPFFYPTEVRIVSQGRGFILPETCALYLVLATDDVAQSYLDRYGFLLNQMEEITDDWKFYYLDSRAYQRLLPSAVAGWQNGLTLRDYQIEGDITPGQQLHLTYTWVMDDLRIEKSDYHFFNHLTNENGELLTQDDAGIVHPVYWRTNDAMISQFYIDLPPDLPPGEYTLYVGMYTWPDIEPVPLSDGRSAYAVTMLMIH